MLISNTIVISWYLDSSTLDNLTSVTLCHSHCVVHPETQLIDRLID